jgi:competence protein ComEC
VNRRFLPADIFNIGSALALLAGALAVQLLTVLPPRWIDALVAVLGVALIVGFRRRCWIGFVLLAAAWTMLRADFALSQRLPHTLEGEDIAVTGVIRGLPRAPELVQGCAAVAAVWSLAIAGAPETSARHDRSRRLRF